MGVVYVTTYATGFWEDRLIADCRRKLAELYFKNPQIANSEKKVILEYWQAYEGLASVLGDRLLAFVDWFLKATSPETITRCLRALKEDGTISLSPSKRKLRQQQEQAWRQYWAQQKLKNGQGAQGLIQQSPEVAQARRELSEIHREYWRQR